MSDHPPLYEATMTLPRNGKQAWSNIMYGETVVPEYVQTGSPIVMAIATFQDGTWVAGGVLKSEEPAEYNIIFMWVYDKKGTQYPGWPIDFSDHEDFFTSGVEFSLTEDVDVEYVLHIVEADS